jgi:STE24 endopeptidase
VVLVLIGRECSLRQYPLYNKTSPPEVLKGHFDQETFEKSQRYGKAKAKFSFVSGIYRQVLESALLYFDFYPWAWTAAESLVANIGYGGQVCRIAHKIAARLAH